MWHWLMCLAVCGAIMQAICDDSFRLGEGVVQLYNISAYGYDFNDHVSECNLIPS